MHILIVEDDELLSEGLTRALKLMGHATYHVSSGEKANAALAGETFDLVVLDVGLPYMDGFEVLRRLRARETNTPVLVLTAKDTVEDRVRGLDLGADDYLTKPFAIAEFEARVRALLRRGAVTRSPRFQHKDLVIDTVAKRVWASEQPVDLTFREWSLLELFIDRPGRVLSKEQIIQSLYSHDEDITPNAVEVCVSRLRAKLESAGFRLRTIRGFGYMWDDDAGAGT